MLLVEVGAEVFLPVGCEVCEGRGGDTSGDFLIYWRLKYVSYDFKSRWRGAEDLPNGRYYIRCLLLASLQGMVENLDDLEESRQVYKMEASGGFVLRGCHLT